MRPKTKVRLVILIVVLVLVGGGIAIVYQIRQGQLNSELQAKRDAGMKAFKDGDYLTALTTLSTYVSKRQQDAEAIFAYGKSRALVEEPDGRHINEGIGVMRRFLELQPGDP